MSDDNEAEIKRLEQKLREAREALAKASSINARLVREAEKARDEAEAARRAAGPEALAAKRDSDEMIRELREENAKLQGYVDLVNNRDPGKVIAEQIRKIVAEALDDDRERNWD